MNDLIQALQIFAKYGNPQWPTLCEHDEFRVLIDPAIVSDEDKAKLADLSFHETEEENFMSYRFGSA